jgi:hypothetical protein
LERPRRDLITVWWFLALTVSCRIVQLKMGLVWLGDSEREDAKEFFRTSINEVVRAYPTKALHCTYASQGTHRAHSPAAGFATGSHPIIVRRRDTITAVVLALRAPLPRTVPHR